MQNLIEVCQDCGSRNLKFGSRDPCEGDYYWCDDCGNGPILFPLNYRRKFIQPVLSNPEKVGCSKIIDAEAANEAILMVKRLHARQAGVL